MTQISRRTFMQKTAILAGAAGTLAHSATNTPTGPLGLPIGAQAWPMRSMLHDSAKFVKMLSDIGVTRLEHCSPSGYGEGFSSRRDPKQVVRIMSNHGVTSESSHFSIAERRHSHQQSIDWAKEDGITQII